MERSKIPYSKSGFIYLIHFDEPYHHARHYIGWTEDIYERFARHVDGRGSPLLAACLNAGIGFRVVAFGRGARKDERFIKNAHDSRIFCPVCKPESTWPFGDNLPIPDGLVALPVCKKT